MLLILQRLPSWALCVIAVSLFFLGVVIQYMGNYQMTDSELVAKYFNKDWFHRNALFFGFPFFVSGFLICKHSLHKTFIARQALPLTVIGFVLLMLESALNFYSESREGGFDNLVALIVLCPPLFILLLRSRWSGGSKNVALMSSGIYIVHHYVLNLLREFAELNSIYLAGCSLLITALISIPLIKISDRYNYIL